MAYIVNQYNHVSSSEGDPGFITSAGGGSATTRQNNVDMGVEGDSVIAFYDPCVRTNNALSPDNHYYCKCQIRRLDTEQKFYIKLCNYEANSVEQYIKTIIVQPSTSSEIEWVTVEFIFTPVDNFDCILFKMQRTIEDYPEQRTPIICYQELGIIQNIIGSKLKIQKDLLKIGVQSRPGFLMCINGEEIRLSRAGIYEIKNGILPINFFSAVAAAEETKVIPQDSNNSSCTFISENDYTTKIDSFVLDYMYNN